MLSLRKVFIILSIICTIIIFYPTSSFAQKAHVHTDHLNVRKGPGMEYELLTQVHENEIYPVLDETEEWVKIQLENDVGWVYKDYLTIEDDFTEEYDVVGKETDGSFTVINDNVHIREGPSVTYDIIDFLNQGDVVRVISETDEWYEIEYGEKRGFIHHSFLERSFSFSNPFKNRTFVIDAGHGGRDVGAIGVEGYYEKDFTWITMKKLQDTLLLLGANVLLTREGDEYVRLMSRPLLANIHDTDAFVSIHYNSFPSQPSVKGIGTYYYDSYDERLASLIQQSVIRSSEAEDRKISYDNLLVLRENFKPSILIELGFISHPSKEQLLLTDSYQNKLVHGISSGLANYLAERTKN